MLDKRPYEPLVVGSLGTRLGAVPALAARLGAPETWRVREVGDGNLNLVFIVEGERGAAVVKQALPYARCVGESWPMSLDRAFFEWNALTRLGQRDPGGLPAVYAFDETQALMVLEYLHPHVILRKALVGREQLPKLASRIGTYLARTMFRGSDLAMDTQRRKADLALFAANVELCGITEDLFFTDPFHESPRNRRTPGLDVEAAAIRADRELKLAAFALKLRFATGAETLLHGDFHTGSVMVTEDDARVIDPEFAFYGPMGFDVGSFLGNLFLAYFSQNGHGPGRQGYADWILDAAEEVWRTFAAEFAILWASERTGMLGGLELFEKADDAEGARLALNVFLAGVWRDAIGFAGLEMHRRILGLAHAEELESIPDEAMRAACERRALKAARTLVLNPASFEPDSLKRRIGAFGDPEDVARTLR